MQKEVSQDQDLNYRFVELLKSAVDGDEKYIIVCSNAADNLFGLQAYYREFSSKIHSYVLWR